MRFLLDQDVPIDVSYSLVQLGHQVVLLREVLDPLAEDAQVIEYAFQNGWILVTCNRDDFLELAQGKPHAGLIILIRRRSRAAERAALIRLIDKAGEDGVRTNINFA
jgi:predicted nuclease of predicted toxin-antitoxin system